MKLLGRGRWRRLLPAKLLLVMRITTAILLIGALHVSASGLGQTVSYSGKNVPLQQVFAAIKQQTGYVFFYKLPDLDGARPVTVDLKNVLLTEALEKVLENQSLNFSIQGNTIFITLRTTPTPVPQSEDSLPRKPVHVKGVVFNENGQPLSGANVTIKETERGTITDAKGEFNLGAIPVGSTVIISFIGYAPQQVKVKEDANIKIYLKVANSELDKVVIQAYGETTQRLQTGDIATVSAAEIEKQPVMNPLLALQGEVPGLDIVQTSGYASAPVKLELRGRSSLNPNFPSDPLYIIDGVPLTVNEVGGLSGYTDGSTGFIQNGYGGPASGQSPLFSLNPSDIESISVLKDADATAIYGSRGANGVVLITTKKGKAGKARLDVSVNQGYSVITKFWQMLNTPQYLSMREEAFRNDGITPTPDNAYDLVLWDTTKYTNWQKFIMGGTGKYTDVNAGLSGGDAHTVYRVNAGYSRQTPINAVSGGDQRGSVIVNLTTKSSDERFTASIMGNYTLEKSNLIAMPGSPNLPPNSPGVWDSAGNLNYAAWAPIDQSFPFGNLLTPYTANTYFLNSNLVLSYQILRGLVVKSSFGYNNAVVSQTNFVPIASQDPATDPVGNSEFGTNFNRNWIVEPQVTYDLALGRGKLSVLAGSSLQENSTDGQYVYGSGYTSDYLLRTISNAPTIYASDLFGEYKFASVYGRANYNWMDKYLINVSARRDGSSKFGPNKEYGDFGAIGVAWIFSEEHWLKGRIPGLSFGKLRGSYGTTGSDYVSSYQYLTRWSGSGLQPYAGIVPLNPQGHADPDFQWQVNKKLEGALELGFLKDRISLISTYYRNRCGDQLVNFPLPVFTGFGTVVANLPALVQNKGWEFKLSAKIIDTRDFTWSFRGNIAFNENKLLAYPDLAKSPYANSFIIGQPVNLIRLPHYTGVDPLTGQYTFFDKNHDGTITANPGPTDDRFVHNLSPKYFGGFGTDFTFKELQLSLFFTYKNQIGPNIIAQGDYPGSAANEPTYILGKEWKYPGDVASVARFTTQAQQSDMNFHNSDAGYTSASYIRLRNLQLTYNLPSSWGKRMRMQSGAIFVRGENLFVITPYNGIDPETQNFGGLPPEKTLTAGLSLKF
jgi:TonB-linked SusC/RagA family outer membrane protein